VLEEKRVNMTKDLLAYVVVVGVVEFNDASTVEAVFVVHDEAVDAEL